MFRRIRLEDEFMVSLFAVQESSVKKTSPAP